MDHVRWILFGFFSSVNPLKTAGDLINVKAGDWGVGDPLPPLKVKENSFRVEMHVHGPFIPSPSSNYRRMCRTPPFALNVSGRLKHHTRWLLWIIKPHFL